MPTLLEYSLYGSSRPSSACFLCKIQFVTRGYATNPFLITHHFLISTTEVESIVRCTAEILADLTAEQRGNVCTSVVRALESDASWVQVYESTGEIRVPEIDVEENIRQQYLQVTEVSQVSFRIAT